MLVIDRVSKAFGGTQALNGVSLTVDDGAVHGLVGHNGSGKSTLVKCLARVHSADSGLVQVGHAGALDSLESAGVRQSGRLHFVHQDLAVSDELSVLDNLRVGLLRRSRAGLVDWKYERQQATASLDAFGLRVDLDAPARVLSTRERALVACARSLATASGLGDLVVLDEPTSYLPGSAARILFDRVRDLVDCGASVLFISHHLEEVLEQCGSVTVLRNGSVVDSMATDGLAKWQLVEMMLGAALPVAPTDEGSRSQGERDAAIRVDGLVGQVVKDVSFAARASEVVGVAGLVGSGADELPYCVMGEGMVSGQVCVRGRRVVPVSVATMWSAGVEFLPARRDTEAGAPDLDLVENLMLYRKRDSSGRHRFLNLKREREAAETVLRSARVVWSSRSAPLSTLSGGNQQKLLIARRLRAEPFVLVLAEPTQGVDVGARAHIHAMIRQAAAAGACVVVYSSDVGELADLCGRVIVVKEGRLAVTLTGDDVTELRLLYETSS